MWYCSDAYSCQKHMFHFLSLKEMSYQLFNVDLLENKKNIFFTSQIIESSFFINQMKKLWINYELIESV